MPTPRHPHLHGAPASLRRLTADEMAGIFGAGGQNRALIGVEPLEAGTPGVQPHRVLLQRPAPRRGDRRGRPDRVGTTLRVDGVTITRPDGSTVNPAFAISTIRIDSLGGNDLIWVQGDLSKSVVVNDGDEAVT